MRFIFAVIISTLLFGCNYEFSSAKSKYNHLHCYDSDEKKVYYHNRRPYYGLVDGIYYYYGYPHTHKWDFYYLYRPPFWYLEETHVHHKVVYVVPISNSWRFNNCLGGNYRVPKRHQNTSVGLVPNVH